MEVLGSLGIRGDHGFPSAPGMRTCGLLHRPKVSPYHEYLSHESHLSLRATEQLGRATSNLVVWPSLSVCVNTAIPASETRLQHDWVHSLCSSYTIPPFLARRADVSNPDGAINNPPGIAGPEDSPVKYPGPASETANLSPTRSLTSTSAPHLTPTRPSIPPRQWPPPTNSNTSRLWSTSSTRRSSL